MLACIFKALSNTQRLRIFQRICTESLANASGDVCYGAVEKAFTKACKCMQLSGSTVSHHIKELGNAGLISRDRDGQCGKVTVNRSALQLIARFLGESLG